MIDSDQKRRPGPVDSFESILLPRPACIAGAVRRRCARQSGILAAMLAMPFGSPATPAPCVEPALARLGAICDQVIVPENPAAPRGRTIALHIVTIPARASAKQPDPVFVLAGGPGQGAASLAVMLAGAHAALNRDRDLVLMDQRGTGRSNALACPAARSGIASLLKSLFD